MFIARTLKEKLKLEPRLRGRKKYKNIVNLLQVGQTADRQRQSERLMVCGVLLLLLIPLLLLLLLMLLLLLQYNIHRSECVNIMTCAHP